MSTYVFKTESLEFSWCNDKSLIVRSKGAVLAQRGVSVKTVNNIDIYMKDAEVIGLRIYDFPEQDQNLASQLITVFVPVSKGYLRKEIIEGLKYFRLAFLYGLLVPQDVANVKLAALRRDYQNILDKLPEFNSNLEKTEQESVKNHINDPLIATTGLIVYATVDVTWLVSETQEQAPDAPEYLNIVDEKANYSYYWDNYEIAVFKGTQLACINYVMEQQKQKYGFSISDLMNTRQQKVELTQKIDGLETVLMIPYQDRWKEVIEEAQIDPNKVNNALKAYTEGLEEDLTEY